MTLKLRAALSILGLLLVSLTAGTRCTHHDSATNPLNPPPPPLVPATPVAEWQSSAPPVTFYSDPRLIQEWDRDASSPLSAVSIFRRIHQDTGLPPIEPGSGASTGEAMARFSDSWGKIVKSLIADEARLIREIGLDWEKDITKTYDVSAAKTAIGKDRFHRGNGNVTRFFNEKWLTSPDGQLLLSGVVYRPDRRDFTPGNCGELRFLYRLGYEVQMKGEVYASRMPFVVNVVFNVKDDGKSCREVASLWRSEPVSDANAHKLAAELLEGPLSFSRLAFQQVEMNAQIARFPSDLENVDGRKFAGQAIYWMRIFALRNGKFSPIPLENTPDVEAIRKDPVKQQALREFVRDNLDDIDRGVFVLPESLDADLALTWSTLGSARTANKPFDALLSTKELDTVLGANGGQRGFIVSGAALLERLNTASCMGCHQSSSTAGFHFLGVDREFGNDRAAVRLATDGNRLELAFSPHFFSESSRRTTYLTALARGEPPVLTRPHPSAPPATWGGEPRWSVAKLGQPCFLEGNAIGPAAWWRCEAGLTCRILAKNSALPLNIGSCLPEEAKVEAGTACRADTLVDEPMGEELLAWNARAFADRVTQEDSLWNMGEGKLTDSAYNCRPSKIGVPLGRVSRQCTAKERSLENFATGAPSEICAIVGGRGFEEMAKGYFDSRKFADGVGRGLLDTCSPSRFCREDYICQEIPDFVATGSKASVKPALLTKVHQKRIGFCTPTYFVYQLRLDGHPNPR